MIFLFFVVTAGVGIATFYLGMGFGELKERQEWESRLALPPPHEDPPLGLPEHAGDGGPYRTPEQPLFLPPPKKRGWFSGAPQLGLSDIFKHFRRCGASMDIYFANNSEMAAEVDFALVLNELEKYLTSRNLFEPELDEMQRLFIALVRERNYQSDADMLVARLKGAVSVYSMPYTMVWALGEIWPPTGATLRQINQQRRYCINKPGNNEDAEKHIREKAKEIFAAWKERDEVAVTMAMCE